MLLKDVPNIKINGIVKVTNKPVDWQTLFRVWNYSHEDTSCDSICSPILYNGQIVLSDETQYSVKFLAEKFYNALPYPYVIADCKFEYDFSLTPVNLEYETDKEMEFFFNFINKCLENTGLYVFLMLSHFRQSANKKGDLKPEHYHFLIPQNDIDDEGFYQGIYRFIDNLKKERVIRRITVKVE